MYTLPSWSHEVQLEAEPGSASLARDFVSLRLVEHGLRDLVDDVRVVVSELVTNAVLHTRARFTVRLAKKGSGVVVTVTDQSSAAPVMAVGGPLDAGGRGLVIVDVLSQEWGVVTQPAGCKSVWASFATDAPVPTG